MPGTNSHRHPGVPAAFTRAIPERQPERKQSKPMTDEELRTWSAKRAEESGVHTAAAEAAKRGKTLMVFMQAQNRSVPYDSYKKLLEEGVLPAGHTDENTSPAGIALLNGLDAGTIEPTAEEAVKA